MTQEDKDILLKDLCARLPYRVKFQSENIETVLFVDTSDDEVWINGTCIDDFKPYLRPMSSMTEEEKKEFIHYAGYEVEESVNGRHYEYYLKDYVGTPETPICNYDAIDWLNAHHFDYRGLIEKDLALEAPENMYINNSKTII